MKVLTESQTSSASGPPLEAFAVVTMVAAVDVVFAVVNLSFSVFVVVKRDADGNLEVQKTTDPSTRRGLGWGVVGGVVLGVIFPPSIIASAAA